MKIKLKPCPFCGAKAEMSETTNNKIAFVRCTNINCSCQTDLFNGRDRKKQAAERWNRRVTDMREEDDGR